IDALRTRQVKNFFTATLLAAGGALMLMGGEGRGAQRGDNKAHFLAGEMTLVGWTALAKRGRPIWVVRQLQPLRSLRDVAHEEERWSLSQLLEKSDIGWHGVKLNDPDWQSSSHSIAFMARPPNEGTLFHVMINAYWEPLSFELPPVDDAGHPWRR